MGRFDKKKKERKKKKQRCDKCRAMNVYLPGRSSWLWCWSPWGGWTSPNRKLCWDKTADLFQSENLLRNIYTVYIYFFFFFVILSPLTHSSVRELTHRASTPLQLYGIRICRHSAFHLLLMPRRSVGCHSNSLPKIFSHRALRKLGPRP